MEVILKMFFLSLSSAAVLFDDKKLIWKSYSTGKVLLITSKIKFIDKREFTRTALNKNSKTSVMYIATLDVIGTDSIVVFLS